MDQTVSLLKKVRKWWRKLRGHSLLLLQYLDFLVNVILILVRIDLALDGASLQVEHVACFFFEVVIYHNKVLGSSVYSFVQHNERRFIIKSRHSTYLCRTRRSWIV